MVVAIRIGLIVALFGLAGFGFVVASANSSKGAVVAAAAAGALVWRGVRAPMSAVEAWMTTSFAVGLTTGAIPAVHARMVAEICAPERTSTALILWVTGIVITCVASAATVKRFRPPLVLRRTGAARVLWLVLGSLMALGSWVALTDDPCWLSDKPAVLALPALTNALLGLFFGWYLAERDPETH